MKDSIMAKCKLCLEEKTLISKSHIIPNFMYKGILKKNKKIVETNLLLIEKALYRPTGIYDKNILCKECDTKVISKLESYAAKIIYENTGENSIVEENENIINVMVKGVEYKIFKLFLLSLLWRASISKQQMFNEVTLGNEVEEKLRRMIHENNPGRPNEFPTSIFGIQSPQNLVLKTIIAPKKLTDEGNVSYMFFINGLFYYYNISEEGMPDIFNRVPIDENNEITIAFLKNETGEAFLDAFIGKQIRLSKKF